MTIQGVIRLRVFSGPHLGAEIILPAGETLIGSDDSCDIIFMDEGLAPRHALVRIDAPQSHDAKPQVHILPVDSQVRIQDQPIDPSGADWAASATCVLGSTTLAWASFSDSNPWQQVIQSLTSSRPLSDPVQDEPAVPVDETDPETPTSLPDNNDIGDAHPVLVPSSRVPRLLKMIFRIAILLSCLAALTVSYEFRPAPSKISKEQLVEILSTYNITDMQVSQSGGFLGVRGIVNTDAERLQILRLAQSLQSPVYLNVQVRADRSGAIAHAFAQRGFFPEIRENAHGNNTSFVVRGYMKDSSTENSVFTALEEDFQAAGTLNFVRNIRHANDVSAAIEPLLSRSSLDFTQIQFQPGVVLLAGSYSAEQRDRLEAIMSQVQQQLEVPVPFEVISAQTVHRAVSDQAQPAESEDIPTSAQDAPKPHTQSRGFEVTGVTMAPLRFITLSTGECIFEGGLLPSGHILEAISTQELQLSKDKTRFTYTLRGANE